MAGAGRVLLAGLAAGLAAAFTGCGVAMTPASAPSDPVAGKLTVLAATSLVDAFQEVGYVLQTRHPGLAIQFGFAASSTLRVQIEHGASFDLFASADWSNVEPLVAAGLVIDPAPFVRNHLAVVVPRTNPARLETFADLARPGIKLVTAARNVPSGTYTRQALEAAAADPTYGPGFPAAVLANVVSEEDSPRQVVARVALGEADAGIVYRSDVSSRTALVRVIEIPPHVNVVATYPIAVAARPQHREGAHAFLALLRSAEGEAILRRHGLEPITPP